MIVPSTLLDYRPPPLVPFLKEHKPLAIAIVAASPFVYYGIKFWWWLRKMKPAWDTLSTILGGPEKHWLYGNLHQVTLMFIHQFTSNTGQ